MTTVTFDAVLATDGRLTDDAVTTAETVRALRHAGYRVGLLHVASRLVSGPASFAGPVRDCLETGLAGLVMPGDQVSTHLLIACPAAAFAEPVKHAPAMRADHAVVIANTDPTAVDDRRYDADTVHKHVSALAGTEAVWAPAGTQIRNELGLLGSVPVTSVDWASDPGAMADQVATVIGAADDPQPLPDGGVEATRGSVVVDLTGGGDELDPLVSSVVRATVADAGPRLVALPAARAAELGGRSAVETFPRAIEALTHTDRVEYLRTKLTGIAATHRPARIVVVDDGHLPVHDIVGGVDSDVTDIWHLRLAGTSEPGDDTLAQHVEAVLPGGWSVTRLADPDEPPPEPAPSLPARMGKRLRSWGAAALRAVRRGIVHLFGGTVEPPAEDHDMRLPVVPTGPGGDDVPIVLVVVTDAYADPGPGVRAIVERQLVAGTFRVALLAPPDWEVAASAAGITVETLLPEAAWTTYYGSGWARYVRRRIGEVCGVIRPATVVLGNALPDDVLLDVIESASR